MNNRKIIFNICVCGEKYSYTEEQLKWANYDTVCPKCHKTLSAQVLESERKEIYKLPKHEKREKHCIKRADRTGVFYFYKHQKLKKIKSLLSFIYNLMHKMRW